MLLMTSTKISERKSEGINQKENPRNFFQQKIPTVHKTMILVYQHYANDFQFLVKVLGSKLKMAEYFSLNTLFENKIESK